MASTVPRVRHFFCVGVGSRTGAGRPLRPSLSAMPVKNRPNIVGKPPKRPSPQTMPHMFWKSATSAWAGSAVL
ncbi:hypothetical protein D3C72_1877410 [compost metagenome]